MSKQIEVYFDSSCEKGNSLQVGTLFFDVVRGEEITAFEYSPSWLALGKDIFFDPDISFFPGRQYPSNNKPVFGFISDVCPDRWGRALLDRQEAHHAREEKRPVRSLFESDYLLGVKDEARMGAFRFSQEGIFLAESSGSSIPPWITLRELEAAARIIDSDTASLAKESESLELLLAPGSSLGGARPKASVQDAEGGLWIAKFPSAKDTYDCSLAELLVYEMAKDCGIETVPYGCEKFSNAGHTFLVKRFDRGGGKRIHFASAMTLLNKTDGDNASVKISYLDIAELIRHQSSSPKEDMRELFRRILFSVAVSNTDDHLRNHGFLFGEEGWRLSPVFDVNPNPKGRALSLNIDDHDNSLSFSLVLDQCEYFDLEEEEAKEILAQIIQVVSGWQQRANALGLSRSEREVLRPALSLVTG